MGVLQVFMTTDAGAGTERAVSHSTLHIFKLSYLSFDFVFEIRNERLRKPSRKLCDDFLGGELVLDDLPDENRGK